MIETLKYFTKIIEIYRLYLGDTINKNIVLHLNNVTDWRSIYLSLFYKNIA